MKFIMVKIVLLITRWLDYFSSKSSDASNQKTQCDDDPEILLQKIKIQLDYLKSLAFAFSGYEQFNKIDDLKFTEETLSKINCAAAEIILAAHDKLSKSKQ